MNNEFPIRQDITVLPADAPKKIKLGFVFFEGEVILKSKKGFYLDFIYDEIEVDGTKVRMPRGRLESFDDIQEGDVVYSTWYDEEVVAMTVENINKEDHTALGKLDNNCYGNLSFDKDCRKCWTCNGYMMLNTEAIAKVSLNT